MNEKERKQRIKEIKKQLKYCEERFVVRLVVSKK